MMIHSEVSPALSFFRVFKNFPYREHLHLVVLQEHAEAQKKKLDDPPPKPQHKDETI
jgi:hypothetical protein